MESASLRGLAAPKGLPVDVREKLVKAVAQAATDPGYLKQAALLFAPVRYLAPAAYEKELLSTEKDLLEFAEAPSPASRLSCQIKFSSELDGLVVRIPEHQ